MVARSRADLGIALSRVRLPYIEGRRLPTHHVCHSGGEQGDFGRPPKYCTISINSAVTRHADFF